MQIQLNLWYVMLKSIKVRLLIDELRENVFFDYTTTSAFLEGYSYNL